MFLCFFRGCSPPDFFVFCSSYGWQPNALLQYLRIALRRAVFLPLRVCYLHGKILYVLCMFLVVFPQNQPRKSHWKSNVHLS